MIQPATDLTLDRRKHIPLFKRVTQLQKKKNLLPILVFTIGVKCKSEPDDRRWVGFVVGVSNELEYDRPNKC